MHAGENQICNLKSILKKFKEGTRLRINYEKSYMVPTNISSERFIHGEISFLWFSA
jgi:hypothetical protein